MKRYPITNIQIDYGWNEPVVYIPSYVDDIGECIGDLIGLGKYLGWR